MEEAKAKQAGRLAKLGGLEESLSTQDTITDAPAQSAVDILVRARSAEAADAAAAGDGAAEAGDKKKTKEKKKKSPKKEKKEKSGPKTKYKELIPIELGLDRRMSVQTEEDDQFDVIVPPGGQPGQLWTFKVEPGEVGELWAVTESLRFQDPPDSHALPGADTVYECVSRAVLRAGLDTISKQVGFCERGEQRVCLESRVYAGRTRVRFEEGWTSVRSGSGKRLLKKLDGLAPWLQAEVEAKERAIAWLELQGYPRALIDKVLGLFVEAGYKPEVWLDRLGDMPRQELADLVESAQKEQGREDELSGYMEEAGTQLLSGAYSAAAAKYRDVLQVDVDNEEAARGLAEAEKGERLAQLTPEQLQAHIAAELGGEMAGGGATPLSGALGVTEGEEASARAPSFDPKKKLPKRKPHFPTRPVEVGSKGPTFFTVAWELAKEDVKEPVLPLYGTAQPASLPCLVS